MCKKVAVGVSHFLVSLFFGTRKPKCLPQVRFKLKLKHLSHPSHKLYHSVFFSFTTFGVCTTRSDQVSRAPRMMGTRGPTVSVLYRVSLSSPLLYHSLFAQTSFYLKLSKVHDIDRLFGELLIRYIPRNNL